MRTILTMLSRFEQGRVYLRSSDSENNLSMLWLGDGNVSGHVQLAPSNRLISN